MAAHPLLTHHFPMLQELVREAAQPYESLAYPCTGQSVSQVGARGMPLMMGPDCLGQGIPLPSVVGSSGHLSWALDCCI